MKKTLDWPTICQAGRDLGAAEKTLEKWRERNSVPHKWRLPIIRHLGLSVYAFDDEIEHAQ